MNDKSGFSLVELLVVLAVVIIVMTMISDDMLQTLRYWVNVNTISEVEQNLRYSMEMISKEIRNANQISYDGTEGREDVVNRTYLDMDSIYIVNGSNESELYLNNKELFINNNSLGDPFEEISVRRVNLYTFGSLYEIYIETSELNFERVPNLTMRKYVFAPNAKP
jgi:type II secretory pathway pseudopilin PulG